MVEFHSILSACTSGGCGAKIGAGDLSGLLSALPRFSSPDLIVGFDSCDDAAVYRLNDQQSLISTVDFFSPMVEDGRTFGRIAAANALSDVYAMGGRPVLALNLVCFPESLSKDILSDILAGGAEKLAEAGVALGGGHSIYDKEPKYGLAVTGLVDTNKVIRNNTPEPGHALILTKPLGVGIIMAAARGEAASETAVEKAVASMQRLNRYAAEKMAGYRVSACTDVTGFGLLAHLLEMCGDKASAHIDIDALPCLPEAITYAKEFLLTAAGQRNRNHFGQCEDVSEIPFAIQEIMFDPQTSGGLLICVAVEEAETLLADIRQAGDSCASLIGRIMPRREKPIYFSGSVQK